MVQVLNQCMQTSPSSHRIVCLVYFIVRNVGLNYIVKIFNKEKNNNKIDLSNVPTG